MTQRYFEPELDTFYLTRKAFRDQSAVVGSDASWGKILDSLGHIKDKDKVRNLVVRLVSLPLDTTHRRDLLRSLMVLNLMFYGVQKITLIIGYDRDELKRDRNISLEDEDSPDLVFYNYDDLESKNCGIDNPTFTSNECCACIRHCLGMARNAKRK